ncbi:MAG: hypothetical protein NT080_05090 [Spirochaetes bacterium]|nr:hypothetical protein [Spirochaetota bacterium]
MRCSPASSRKFAAIALLVRSVLAPLVPAQDAVLHALTDAQPEAIVACPPARASFALVYVGALPAPELKQAASGRAASAPVAPELPVPQVKNPPAAAKPQAVPPARPQAAAQPAPAAQKPSAAAPSAPAAQKPAAADTVAQKPAVPAAAETPARTPADLPPVPSSKTPVTDPAAARAQSAVPPVPQSWKEISVVASTRFEVQMPGSGWAYLGEINGREGIRHDSRRFEGSNAVFAFIPERIGDYWLRFKRQDPVQGFNDDRLVKVSVVSAAVAGAVPAASSSTSATPAASPGAAAPASSPTPASPAQAPAAAVTTPASTVPTTAAAAASAAGISPDAVPGTPEALLAYARDELAALRPHNAIAVLERYLALYPAGSDELFMLFAKAYESDGPYRDIRKAHANYRRVRDEYPRSKYWKEAADRVAYIERRYFDIR